MEIKDDPASGLLVAAKQRGVVRSVLRLSTGHFAAASPSSLLSSSSRL